uniref:Uncharacterized protein n=1 Tax=Solanum tuberosum TaxID=4113 RepID=M1CYY2_SOLTU
MLDVSKSQEKDGVAQAITKTAESPLILATKSGCTEIVDEILKTYPQAVEYVDSKGRNILHVAIKYRQMQIFDIVKKMGMPMRRLKRKVTHQGNSILHMVGVKHQDNEIADMRSPALLLQENLLLFERVKKVCSADYFEIINEDGKTAEELFTKANATLGSETKEINTTKNLSKYQQEEAYPQCYQQQKIVNRKKGDIVILITTKETKS